MFIALLSGAPQLPLQETAAPADCKVVHLTIGLRSTVQLVDTQPKHDQCCWCVAVKCNKETCLN
jgi:hypothetical protein